MTAVIREVSGRVATLTLNRPERLNAINRGLLSGLESGLTSALADDDVDIVLLKGAGSAFCSGDDLLELAEEPPQDGDVEETIGRLQNITKLMVFGDKSIVCIVDGWAIGGGASWPFNADYAVWGDKARLRFPEGRHGLFPSGGITWLLSQFSTPHRAHEILTLGETLGAQQILSAGLARKIAGDAEDEAAALVQSLLSLPRGSLRRYKQARASALRAPLEAALAIEAKMMAEAVREIMATGAVPQIKRA